MKRGSKLLPKLLALVYQGIKPKGSIPRMIRLSDFKHGSYWGLYREISMRGQTDEQLLLVRRTRIAAGRKPIYPGPVSVPDWLARL